MELPLFWLVQNHQDWSTVLTVLETGLNALVRVWWPLPFHPPEIHESPSYAESPLSPRRFPLMPEALYPNYAPILFVKGLDSRAGAWASHAVSALRQRWQTDHKQNEESFINVLNEVGMHLYLTQSECWDMFTTLVHYAQRLTRAPVVYVAVRRESEDIIETVANQGIANSGFGFHLKVGRGVGGMVSKTHQSIVISDYRRSAMRDATVTQMIDNEGILSGSIVPWTMPTGQQGVLYVTYRQAYPVCPTDALLLERFVRGLNDVYRSQEAIRTRQSECAYAVSFPEQLHVARRLKDARDTLSWPIFKEAAESLGIRADITDPWNLSVCSASDELPSAPPSGVAHIGSPPYEGTLRIWMATDSPRFTQLWPTIRESASWLLLESKSQEWNELYQRSLWISQMPAMSRLQTGADTREPQQWDELVGIKIAGDDIEWSRSDALSVRKLTTRTFTGTELYWDGLFLWLLIQGHNPRDTWPRLRHEISRLSTLDLIMMSSLRTSKQPLQSAMNYIRTKILEWTSIYASGTYRALNSHHLPRLLAMIDKPSRDEFVEHTIGPLTRVEASQDLIDTLYSYLATGSVQRAASRLFLHQNTVRYRLRKVCEILELGGLDDPSDRENLLLASRIWMLPHNSE